MQHSGENQLDITLKEDTYRVENLVGELEQEVQARGLEDQVEVIISDDGDIQVRFYEDG